MEWRKLWKWIKFKEMKRKKEIDSFPLHIIQELQALWGITVNKGRWDQRNKPAIRG